jgi:hypothetical protein
VAERFYICNVLISVLKSLKAYYSLVCRSLPLRVFVIRSCKYHASSICLAVVLKFYSCSFWPKTLTATTKQAIPTNVWHENCSYSHVIRWAPIRHCCQLLYITFIQWFERPTSWSMDPFDICNVSLTYISVWWIFNEIKGEIIFDCSVGLFV